MTKGTPEIPAAAALGQGGSAVGSTDGSWGTTARIGKLKAGARLRLITVYPDAMTQTQFNSTLVKVWIAPESGTVPPLIFILAQVNSDTAARWEGEFEI